MIRSRMRNCFLKHRSYENRRFQKQRDKCVSLLRKAKKEYFSSFNVVTINPFGKQLYHFSPTRMSLQKK